MTGLAPRVSLAGETLRLLPERAAYWERAQTLLVADAHFGKAATFRASAIPVPHGTTAEGLARLDALLDRLAVDRIVFLGDLLHAREGRAADTLRLLAEWREEHARTELVLVRGNHDRMAGDPPAELRIACVDEPLREGPLAFAHHPGELDDGYQIAGHLHPGLRLRGPGGDRARLACFWIGAARTILPAFGDFTGLADITPGTGDRVFVIAGRDVIER